MDDRSAIVRKTLLRLSTGISGSLLDSAELLFEAQENSYPAQWGYKNLEEYAAKELKLKLRKAQILAKIVRVYRAVGLVRSQIEPHWNYSKFREISTLNPEGSYYNRDTKQNEPLAEHIVRLITEADELTVEKVKLEVARLKGMVGPDKRIVRSYSTNESAWKNVIVPAMEIMRRKMGSAGRDEEGIAKEYTDGACIEAMCMEVLSDPTNYPPVEVPEEELMGNQNSGTRGEQ
jgi:hypothetical protein